jgi:ribosomal protein S18 acetylase RimI-like enzyme
MFPPSHFPPFEAIPLDTSDVPRLQTLFAACADYFHMVSGEAMGPEETEKELNELPPGKTLDDKFFLGLQLPDGTLGGILDVVRDYPESGIWYLGLLLLHPTERGHGRGASLHAQLRKHIQQQGGKAIRLGVLDQNDKALRFWERLGYIEIARKPYPVGKLQHTVRVMQLQL